MASKRAKFTVGIFVIIGIAVAAGAIIWFGFSDYFEKGKFYAAYFDESVQGLNKDSSVKYRGVSVGRVKSIDVAPDDKLICVVMKIEREIKLDKDIVAQLKSVGITGIMFVELDKRAKDEPDLSPKITFNSEYPVVGTRPSEIKKYLLAIENVLNQLKSLDVKGISERAKTTLDSINNAVSGIRVKEISDNLMTSFKNLEQILKSLKKAGTSLDGLIVNVNGTVSNINDVILGVNKIIKDNEKNLSSAMSDLTQSIKKANDILGKGENMISSSDQSLKALQRNVSVTLQNLEQASRQLSLSMEQITDQPSLLLFAKPPPERKTESGN